MTRRHTEEQNADRKTEANSFASPSHIGAFRTCTDARELHLTLMPPTPPTPAHSRLPTTSLSISADRSVLLFFSLLT